MKITLRFLEPFRIIDWIRPDGRTPDNTIFQRGLTFARWHKSKANDKGRPFITGTLVRSAAIRAAERLLVLSGGNAGEKACCPGKFSTRAKASDMFLRKRATLKWTDKKSCDPNSPCPFCELLGPGALGKKADDRVNPYINFGNLNLPGDPEYASPLEIAARRVVNRVDYASGKAYDFFRIFEVDSLFFPCFHGEITMGENISSQAEKLLEESLSFTDQLCGALCVIHFDDDISGCEKAVPASGTKSTADTVQKTAEAIADIFRTGKQEQHDPSQSDKAERIRLLASAVRELGRDTKMVSELPLNHKGKKERPRPTWAIRYDDKENDKVPGRKFYVHHNGWEGINKGKHPITNEKIEPDPNNRTVEPLDSENTFTFEIFFENLEPHELGLLLSSLRLEKGLAHKLGMAKSMGFGSIGIDVENVSLREKSGVWENKTGKDVDDWIREGKNKAAEWSGEEKGNKSDHTAALKRLLYFPKDQNPKVHYPPLKKEKDGKVPGYEELKQEFKKKGSDRKKGFTRKELLTTSWMSWHLTK